MIALLWVACRRLKIRNVGQITFYLDLKVLSEFLKNSDLRKQMAIEFFQNSWLEDISVQPKPDWEPRPRSNFSSNFFFPETRNFFLIFFFKLKIFLIFFPQPRSSKIIYKYPTFQIKFGFTCPFMLEKVPHAIGN
jgi:hypothetical protein